MSAYLSVAEVQALIEDRAKTESAIRNLRHLAHANPPETFVLVSVADLRRFLAAYPFWESGSGIPA